MKVGFQASFCLLKVNNRNTRTRCEICSKLAIKTPERHHWRRSGVFIGNFEHNITPCFSVSIVNFEHVISGLKQTEKHFTGYDFSKTMLSFA